MLSNQRSQYLNIPPAGASDEYGTYKAIVNGITVFQEGANILKAPIYMGAGLEKKIYVTKGSTAQELDVTFYCKDFLGNDFNFDMYIPGATNGTISTFWISVIYKIVVNIFPTQGFSIGGACSRGYMLSEGNHTSHMVLTSGGGDTWTMKGATFEIGESVQSDGGAPQNNTTAFFNIADAFIDEGSNLTYLTELTIPLGLFRLEQNNSPSTATLQWYMGQKVFR